MQYVILLWLYLNDWRIIDSKKHLPVGKVGITRTSEILNDVNVQ